MKNFEIGKELVNLLLNESDVTKYVNDKIFPLVANVGTTFPFIVYRRTSYQPNSNKDFEDEIVSVEITILSENYAESVDIANNVAQALLHKKTEIIDDIKITNIYEDYADNTYIQKININIYIGN